MQLSRGKSPAQDVTASINCLPLVQSVFAERACTELQATAVVHLGCRAFGRDKIRLTDQIFHCSGPFPANFKTGRDFVSAIYNDISRIESMSPLMVTMLTQVYGNSAATNPAVERGVRPKQVAKLYQGRGGTSSVTSAVLQHLNCLQRLCLLAVLMLSVHQKVNRVDVHAEPEQTRTHSRLYQSTEG